MERVDVAIIGSGFSGLGMAIRLKQRGNDDFVILERDDDVGGTWNANTYPGCACDIPSHLYSFSFAPNPDWSQTYSPQPEIRDYLHRVADDFGVRPHLRLRTTVTGAEWDAAEGRWTVETDRGELSARVLISAMGPLTEPKVPDLPGLDQFEGETWHSARWNHDYGIEGKRVASIGTGASAIQYVPQIQPQVEQLHVFQRTPPWIAPHRNRRITRLERALYRAFPPAQRINRGTIYALREALVVGFAKRPQVMKVIERVARLHREQQVKDPELLRKVTPDYAMGCKRILPSNHWYPTLQQPNVELVTGGVREVRRNSVVGEDGVEREVDAIVFGTGFQVTEMPAADLIAGTDGRPLSEVWAGSPRSHRGATIPGFPNLFLLLGPNTGLGHNSVVYMAEAQAGYVMSALGQMGASDLETVEVRPEAQESWNDAIQGRMGGTVWLEGGCQSWYLDANGRNGVWWPGFTIDLWRRTRRFDRGSYLAEPA